MAELNPQAAADVLAALGSGAAADAPVSMADVQSSLASELELCSEFSGLVTAAARYGDQTLEMPLPVLTALLNRHVMCVRALATVCEVLGGTDDRS